MPTRRTAAAQVLDLARPSILVVDPDDDARDAMCRQLRRHCIEAIGAENDGVALSAARTRWFDLVLVLHAPPMLHGPALVRVLRQHTDDALPIIVTGRDLPPPAAVEAMRAGATDAVLNPADVEAAILPRVRARRDRLAGGWAALRSGRLVADGCSAADRLASWTLQACGAPDDPRTLPLWAAAVQVHPRALTGTCHIVDVEPPAARDLMRVLRALGECGGRMDAAWALLDVRDERTLDRLRERSGLAGRRHEEALSLETFLFGQTFVAFGHPLRAALTRTLGLATPGATPGMRHPQ